MQKDGSHDANPPGLPESPLNPHASSSRFQPNEKMKYRLEKLAEWRIDQSSIEFPKEPCEIRGGNATVSRAVLVSPSDSEDSIKQHGNTRVEGVDSDGTDGQTSRQRKDVAVKKMNMSSDVARVLGLTVREAEFLVGLSHQNVIKLKGFVEDLSKDIVWLVFPWEENGTLRDFIASVDWEIPERIWLIADVASGVEYLHSQRPPICHGDLKSLNILVNSKCFAVITDFGSARRLKVEELSEGTKPAQNKPQAALSLEATFCASTNTITLTGDHYTLRWAAPELLYEEEPSLCSDIWAFGWVAYEVMTNSIPFQNVKDAIVIKRVIHGDLPSITGDARMSLILALCSLMIMCWSIDPSKRPTAEDCRKSINWMPRIVPNPIRTVDTAASRARSPELLMRLGTMYWHQGDYSNALDLFTKALDGYADNGNKRGKVTALLELGQVHRLRNECGQAIPFYSEALQICTDIGDRAGRADALWGLAEVHRFQKEYGQAITFYSEALQFATDVGDRMRRACALKGLADVHQARNEYDQAITFYSEALQICAESRDRQGSAQALRGLAEVHRLRNQYSQATTLFLEALQISSDMGNRSGRAQALLGLAKVRRDQDDYIDAIRLYTEATEVFEQTGDAYNADYASKQAAKVCRLLQ